MEEELSKQYMMNELFGQFLDKNLDNNNNNDERNNNMNNNNIKLSIDINPHDNNMHNENHKLNNIGFNSNGINDNELYFYNNDYNNLNNNELIPNEFHKNFNQSEDDLQENIENYIEQNDNKKVANANDIKLINTSNGMIDRDQN